MFVFFGCSSVAQYKLLNKSTNDSASFLLVNAGFGFGILAAILTVGKVSGIFYLNHIKINSKL